MGKSTRIWTGSRRADSQYKRKLRKEKRIQLQDAVRTADASTYGYIPPISNDNIGYDLHRKCLTPSFRAKINAIKRVDKKLLPKNYDVNIRPTNDNKAIVVEYEVNNTNYSPRSIVLNVMKF